MCASRVTRHTSIRYSTSCHTPVNMGASIFFTAEIILAFRSARSFGNGPLLTLHEKHFAYHSGVLQANYRTPQLTTTLSFTITADQAVHNLLMMGKERPKHVEMC
jgi:hypothetical protein